ncbi:hypothetical protein [Jannaschia sp. R86511]|uniref:hypothetical protein n=1 Tax=Jannaschia sp. R86511 TaxID=3093853 RepID=UPI0036D2523C
MDPGDLLAVVARHVDETAASASPGPRLVAVDGADGAGKSTFATGLAGVLRRSGCEVHQVSVDGFHHRRDRRYARGRRSPAGFWLDSYDYEALRLELLVPWRRGSGSYRAAVRDVRTDTAVESPSRAVPPRGVLVVDGIFLLRDELAGSWDLTIRLEATPPQRFRRMARRDGSPADPHHPDNRRYRLGQRLYERVCDPTARADLVIGCDDWDDPQLLRSPRKPVDP